MKTLGSILVLSLCLVGISWATSETPPAAPKAEKINEKEAKKKRAPSSEIPARREFPLSTQFKPCEDFYQYVCSEVNQSFKLRDDRSRHTFAFSDSAERILEFNKKFFKNIDKEKRLSARSQQLKDNYQACMNEKASEKEEKEFVKRYVDEISAVKTREQLVDLAVQHQLTTGFSFVSIDNSAHLDNPSQWQLYYGSGVRFLPERSYYEKEEVLKDYQIVMTEFFKTLQLDQPEKRAQAVIDFEKRLDKVHPLPVEVRQRWATKKYISQADFLKKYPALKQEKVLAQFDSALPINELLFEDYEFLNKALQTEDVEVLKNVMIWRQVSPLMRDAYKAQFDRLFAFSNKHLGGPLKPPDRQERCTRIVAGAFDKELDAELLPRLFPNFPEERFVNLVERVRGSILQGLEKNTWLSADAKKAAIQKIKKAQLFLVKPRNDKEWDFNPLLKYSKTQPYSNQDKLTLALKQKMVKETKEPRDPTIWHMSPLTVNAYYSPSDNKFVMPVGILQYPFYDQKGSDIENFGAVGAVIGHELGHSVDDQGSRFDAEGKLNQWMTMKDLAEFKNRSSKMVEQFNKAGHNGALTLGENIGDLVGVTFASQAAFGDKAVSDEDARRFFVGYGRVWCTVMRDSARERQLKTDPHSLSEARVNEQVKHQPRFEKAYACKPSDPMVLKDSERVQIW